MTIVILIRVTAKPLHKNPRGLFHIQFFPFLVRLPFAVRLGLQVLTLLSGTLSGSVAILLTQPLFSLARPRTVAMVVLVNAILSVVVGIALHTYDSMRRQIEASYRALREK